MAQNYKYRSVGKDRKPGSKLIYLWSINLRQKRQEYTVLERQSFQQMVLGKQTRHMLKMKLDHSSTSYTKISVT